MPSIADESPTITYAEGDGTPSDGTEPLAVKSVDAYVDGDSWVVPAGYASAVFVLVHGSDCWITRRVGYKGIYPAD